MEKPFLLLAFCTYIFTIGTIVPLLHDFMNTAPRIAIVCDWLTNFAGGEQVILELHRMFPDAPIFTSVYNKQAMPEFREAKVHTTFLDKFPFAPLSKKKHQLFLNFMPLAFETIDLSDFDIVISSSHSCAKGVITKPETLHVSYCHTPMRYAWDDCHNYIKNSGFPAFLRPHIYNSIHNIRMWDYLSSKRVDVFVANSHFVRKRIQKFYREDATVIYPPVNTSQFRIAEKEDYYVALGRLIDYKRFDLAVEACTKLKKPLKVIGNGPCLEALKAKAGPTVEFLGRVSDEVKIDLLSRAKGFFFPQVEDFGIVTIEAAASGTPTIAFRKGGSLESVIEGITGTFFEEQTVESLAKAINRFETMEFDAHKIRQHALKFDTNKFRSHFKDLLQEKYGLWQQWLADNGD